MNIYFAGDHAGFEMKKELINFVRSLGHEVEDMGPYHYVAGDDYPDYVIPLARLVAEKGEMGERGEKGREVKGIVVAGSGQGEVIAANRIKGARAVFVCGCNLDMLKASRDHNDSNIFCIGARFCTLEEAQGGIKVWLETPFSNEERHIRRLKKIDAWK